MHTYHISVASRILTLHTSPHKQLHRLRWVSLAFHCHSLQSNQHLACLGYFPLWTKGWEAVWRLSPGCVRRLQAPWSCLVVKISDICNDPFSAAYNWNMVPLCHNGLFVLRRARMLVASFFCQHSSRTNNLSRTLFKTVLKWSWLHDFMTWWLQHSTKAILTHGVDHRFSRACPNISLTSFRISGFGARPKYRDQIVSSKGSRPHWLEFAD